MKLYKLLFKKDFLKLNGEKNISWSGCFFYSTKTNSGFLLEKTGIYFETAQNWPNLFVMTGLICELNHHLGLNSLFVITEFHYNFK